MGLFSCHFKVSLAHNPFRIHLFPSYFCGGLLEKSLSFSKHTAVLGAFGLHFVKTELIEQRFHQYLIQAEKLRSTADYAIEVVISDSQAKEQLQNAEAFIAMATQFLTTETDTPEA
jgi:uncharacterized protein (UPF0332 family)